MLLLGMLFGLLVLGPLLMFLVFAVLRSARAMALLRDLARPRPPVPPLSSQPEAEPES